MEYVELNYMYMVMLQGHIQLAMGEYKIRGSD